MTKVGVEWAEGWAEGGDQNFNSIHLLYCLTSIISPFFLEQAPVVFLGHPVPTLNPYGLVEITPTPTLAPKVGM